MSFRRFVYYSTLVGAWAAFFGWALARLFLWLPSNPSGDVVSATTYGLFLGLTVAFGLSLVDALWNFSLRQFVAIFLRVGAALFVGLLSGAACGALAGTTYYYVVEQSSLAWLGGVAFIVSWIGLGLLIGLSVSLFDFVAGLARKDARGAAKKLLKCMLGGTLGGIVGGILAWVLRFQVGGLLGDPGGTNLWTPTAVGFVILAGLIGLLVGLSQIVLLEAWIKVEAGFRPGRDLILSRDRTVIGRAEGSDIALFGDSGVEKQHALILRDQGGFYLEPMPSAPGTYVNDQPIAARTLLRTGDLIRVGKSLLRFNQRRKR